MSPTIPGASRPCWTGSGRAPVNLAEQANQSVRWSTVLSLWLLVAGLVQVVVFARYLAPEEFGGVAAMMLVLVIADVFVRVGFSDGIIANQSLTREQLSTLYWMNVGLAVVVYGFIAVMAAPIGLLVGTTEFTGLLRAIAVVLVIGACAVQFEALARKALHFRVLSLAGIARSVVGLILLVVGLQLGWGLWAYVVSTLLAQCVMTATMLVYARRQDWLPALQFAPAGVTELVRFGAYRVGAAFLNNLSNRVDQMAILAVLGAAELGYYAMAHNIAMKPFQKIGPILSRVSFPVFARVAQNQDRLQRGYRKGVRMILFVNAPLLVGYIAVAPQLVEVFLGEDWRPMVVVSQILAIYALLRSVLNINIGLILARGHYRWPLWWNLAMCVVMPLAIYAAASFEATIVAVATALLLVQCIVFVVSYFIFSRRLLGAFGAQYMLDVAKPVCAAVLMFIAVRALDQVVTLPTTMMQLLALVGGGALAYALISCVVQPGAIREAWAVAVPGREPSA